MSSVGIYIIDDSDELLQGYRHVFQPIGEVHSFAGPTEFLKHLEDNPKCRPDLVVTDLSMPEMNGLEMVKKAQEKGVFFPSILVSGYLNKEMAIQANEIGVWRILEKPVAGKALAEAARELLREHEFNRVRHEIRETMVQLREMFSAFQLLCIDELQLHATETNLTSPNDSERSLSLGEALLDIEERLERLNKAEHDLEKGFKAAQLARTA